MWKCLWPILTTEPSTKILPYLEWIHRPCNSCRVKCRVAAGRVAAGNGGAARPFGAGAGGLFPVTRRAGTSGTATGGGTGSVRFMRSAHAFLASWMRCLTASGWAASSCSESFACLRNVSLFFKQMSGAFASRRMHAQFRRLPGHRRNELHPRKGFQCCHSQDKARGQSKPQGRIY